MSSPAGAIDLGELSRTGAPEPAAPLWPGVRRLRQRFDRPLPAVLAAGLALLLSVTLTGAPAQPAPFERQFQLTAAHTALGGSHLYAVAPDPDTDGARLTAYRLADGGVDWQTPLPATAEAYRFYRAGGAQLLVALPLGPDIDGLPQTHGVDWETGELRWSAAGTPIDLAGDTVVLRGAEPAVTAVDLDTGAQLWSLTTGEYGSRVFTVAGTIMHQTGDELTAYDSATGERLAGRRFESSRVTELYGEDSQLLLLRHELPGAANGTAVTGYEPRTLEVRWRIELDGPVSGLGQSLPCGDLICIFGVGPARAVDPETGDPVWSSEGTLAEQTLPLRLFADDAHPAIRGHLVVVSPRGPDDDDGRPLPPELLLNQHQVILSTATGEPVLELDGWQLLPTELPEAAAAGAGDPPAPWVFRPPEPEGGRGWVGRLRDDLSGVEPLAAIPDAQQCYAQPPYLVCGPRVDDSARQLTVWRMRE